MKKIKSGFTLIELLVVISIIGMLTALIVANYNAARSRARDAQRKSDLNQIKRALRMYYNDQTPTVYPATGEVPFGSIWQTSDGAMIYMKTVPQDPSPGETYSYQVDPSYQDFCLWAELENKADGDIDKSQARCSNCTATGDDNYVVCAD